MRLALIDYLREWRRAEQMEHLQKIVTRDLLAFEVKHAVVPVQVLACIHAHTHADTHTHTHAHTGAHTCTRVYLVPVQPFAKRLDKFFHEGLLRAAPRPAPPTTASLAEELRIAGAALLCHARSLPTELPARLLSLGSELKRLGLDLESIESGMLRAGLPARLWRMRVGLERRLSLTLDGLRTVSAQLLAVGEVVAPTWLRLWARARTKGAYSTDNVY